MVWMLIEDRLCLQGYDIYIEAPKPPTTSDFTLISKWHGKSDRLATLNFAKMAGENWAKEIDAFKGG